MWLRPKPHERMAITYHDAKRDWTLRVRGLDFAEAEAVFAGTTVDLEDAREEYGERRYVCIGYLRSRIVVIAWTPRGADRHVFGMRKANDREQDRYRERLGQG